MGNWESNEWRWKFDWTTKLSAAETISAHDLLMLLDHIRPRRDPRDRWKGTPHATGLFSVNSAYVCLLNKFVTDALDHNMVLALNKLWITNAPSKASIFGWRLLLDKFPTKVALINEGIITRNLEMCCVYCLKEVEDIQHVFFKCDVIVQVWSYIFKWMGVNFLVFTSVLDHLLSFGGIIKGKNTKRLRHIIWLATTWCIWRTRNNILFR
jgi:hypothetical protein